MIHIDKNPVFVEKIWEGSYNNVRFEYRELLDGNVELNWLENNEYLYYQYGNIDTIEEEILKEMVNINNLTLDKNTNYSIQTLIDSDVKGLEKYGKLLSENSEDNFVDHAISECGDMLKYLTRFKFYMKEMCEKYSNEELGKEIRRIYG